MLYICDMIYTELSSLQKGDYSYIFHQVVITRKDNFHFVLCYF